MKMTCPKCNLNQPKQDECSHCGVIISNYANYLEAKFLKKEKEYNDLRIKFSRFPLKNINSPVSIYLRFIMFAIMTVLSINYLSNNITDMASINTLLNYINVPFHEGGHALSVLLLNNEGKLSTVLSALSGALFQTATPLIFFFITRYSLNNAFLGAACLWWAGVSMVNTAIYVNDARTMSDPLNKYGFDSITETHDWNIALGVINKLEFDHFIANSILTLSTFFLIGSCLYMAYLIYFQHSTKKEIMRKKEDLKKW